MNHSYFGAFKMFTNTNVIWQVKFLAPIPNDFVRTVKDKHLSITNYSLKYQLL